MKSLTFCLAILLCTILPSCTHETEADPAYTGETELMACFNRIGIKTADNRGELMYIIPDNLPSKFDVAGKRLRFDAEVRSNTLEPTFPDPSIDASTVYQATVSNVREAE